MLLKFNHFIWLIPAMSCMIHCTKNAKEADPFLIAPHQIGLLTNTSTVQELATIFANDSIAKGSSQLLSSTKEITIYDTQAHKLLILEATTPDDPNSTIQNIQIIDARYHTASGLSVASHFKDIKEQYSISKIANTLSTAVVFVDSIQASITIDKKELPITYRNNTHTAIEATQIPDTASIKHFLISWDKN